MRDCPLQIAAELVHYQIEVDLPEVLAVLDAVALVLANALNLELLDVHHVDQELDERTVWD